LADPVSIVDDGRPVVAVFGTPLFPPPFVHADMTQLVDYASDRLPTVVLTAAFACAI